jgi:hypothetical protein
MHLLEYVDGDIAAVSDMTIKSEFLSSHLHTQSQQISFNKGTQVTMRLVGKAKS